MLKLRVDPAPGIRIWWEWSLQESPGEGCQSSTLTPLSDDSGALGYHVSTQGQRNLSPVLCTNNLQVLHLKIVSRAPDFEAIPNAL